MRTRSEISVNAENLISYGVIKPLQKPIPAERQAARRHYGVHPYFTRRPYNVVRCYILHYSKERDLILDPFGGSGVTAIEAFLENRIGIQNDINPLANFIACGIVELSKGDIQDYKKALNSLQDRCRETIAQIQTADPRKLTEIQRSVSLPENVRLPKNADVEYYYDLFSRRQLLSLALLKAAIADLPGSHAKKAMLLAWSAALTKLNRTFLSAEGRAESRGGSSIFSIYRYKVAKHPIELPPWETFEERAKNVIAAKAEIDKAIETKRQTVGWHGRFEAHMRDIEELEHQFRDQVDYIFTDPPYGGHISYLDLSTLWNVWLDQMPTARTRQLELIVGGELNHAETTYVSRLGRSIQACINMLKKDRWLSVVFQHWNVAYFEAILTSAAEAGAELRAAISQVGDPIWSMHKKKGNESVLAGEMILTFYKTGKQQRVCADRNFDVAHTVGTILSSSPSRVYGESLFNRLVLEAWHRSAIGALAISKKTFTELIRRHGWHYDEKNHYWVKNGQQNLF
ncbi:MAG: hypothetical protein HY649_08840 [Acidobacteria bacterium]|nr:hypothetical protein [Acidobacteriota bacterium]